MTNESQDDNATVNDKADTPSGHFADGASDPD